MAIIVPLFAQSAVALVMTTAVVVASAQPAPQPDPFAKCHALFAQQPDNYDSAYCFFEVGTQQRRADEAARQFEGLMQRYPENWWLPLAYGHVYRATDPPRAEALYRRAADAFRTLGNADGEILARSNLRNFLFPRGRVDDAAAEMARVVEIGAAVSDPLLKARAWTLEATHVQDSGGDLGLAYRLLKQTEAAIFPDGPYRLQRTTLNSLGLVAFRLGRFDEALAVFEKLDVIATAAGEGLAVANARFNILNTSALKETLLPTPGARARLRKLAEGSLAAGIAGQNREMTMKSHLALAELLARDSSEAALSHADDCLELSANNPHDEAACSWIRASLLQADAPDQAREAARRAIDATVRAKNRRTETFSAGYQMRFSWDANPPDHAIADSLAAIDTIERLRSLQDDAQSSAGLFSAWTSDYYWLSGRLLREDPTRHLELAFSITERMRARVLLDSLVRVRTALASAPAVAAPTFATLSGVQSKLADNEALLSFQVGLWETYDAQFGGGSWLIAVTRHTRTVYRLPDRARLVPLMPVFNGLVRRSDTLQNASAVRLYNELLADALAALPPGVERLILIPDGALHQLPFDALRARPDAPVVAASYELVVAPSATLWLRWREKGARQPSGKALTFADPDLRDGVIANAETRSALPVGGLRLGRLPHARRESRAIADYYALVETLVGARATEKAVKERTLHDYDIVHFAAHAIADEARPERSAVLLSAGAESEDGLLQAAEIEGLNLEGTIVVLSACQTASGAVLSGEGVLSLARAFFQAGAHSVIGSRWPIRDEDAASLFEAFYRHLARGASLSEALKEAKVEAIANRRPAAAWAGLVLLGDGDFRPFPNGRPESRSVPLMATVIAVALLAGGLVAWRLVRAPRSVDYHA